MRLWDWIGHDTHHVRIARAHFPGALLRRRNCNDAFFSPIPPLTSTSSVWAPPERLEYPVDAQNATLHLFLNLLAVPMGGKHPHDHIVLVPLVCSFLCPRAWTMDMRPCVPSTVHVWGNCLNPVPSQRIMRSRALQLFASSHRLHCSRPTSPL